VTEKSVTLGGKVYLLRELNMLESMQADAYVARLADGGPTTGVMQLKCYAVCSIRSIDGRPVNAIASWGLYQAVCTDIPHSLVNGLVDGYIEFLPKAEPETSPNDDPAPVAS
jgi:hypothetical protein